MAVYELEGKRPRLGSGVWIADTAAVIGDVELGANASVWFGAVIRGDTEHITVGADTNIQDGSVLHADAGKPLVIGAGVTVGHQVMLHGCSVADGALVGNGAVILNGAKIGRNCIVGAGSVVTENKEFPDNSLIIGSPARVIKTLDAAAAEMMKRNAVHYVANAVRFAKGLKKIG